MRLYQVYNTVDMAGSDHWETTLKEVQAHLDQVYGITTPVKLDHDGEWECEVPEGVEGGNVYVVRHTIKPRAAEMAWALQNLPCR